VQQARVVAAVAWAHGLCPAPAGADEPLPPAARRAPDDAPTRSERRPEDLPDANETLWFGRVRGGAPDLATIRELARCNAQPGSTRAFARTVRAVIRPDGQYLRTCREMGRAPDLPPVALFWGEGDPVIPVAHGRAALHRLRHATLRVSENEAPRRAEADRDAGRPPCVRRPQGGPSAGVHG